MDKYKSKISLHRKYRQSILLDKKSNQQPKQLSADVTHHHNEASSFMTASTISASSEDNSSSRTTLNQSFSKDSVGTMRKMDDNNPSTNKNDSTTNRSKNSEKNQSCEDHSSSAINSSSKQEYQQHQQHQQHQQIITEEQIFIQKRIDHPELEEQTSTINSYNSYYINNMVPTEAQLRWAQFHFKKRSLIVKENIKKLMMSPLNEEGINDESYEEEEDDNNYKFYSCISSDDDYDNDKQSKNMNHRRRKVKISKGRKSLLRLSERKTISRRNYIKKHGFLMQPDDNDDDFSEDCDNDNISCNENKEGGAEIADDEFRHDSSIGIDEITEALHVNDDCVFSLQTAADNNYNSQINTNNNKSLESKTNGRDMGLVGSTILNGKKKKKSLTTAQRSSKKPNGNTAKHLKGKRSMVTTADEDEERIKRFEEAYLLMCSAGDESNPNADGDGSHNITPTKRWTRGSHVPVAVSIDGRIYDDLQRSPAFKDTPSSRFYAAQMYGAELNGKELTDKLASWMMHLPKRSVKDGLLIRDKTLPVLSEHHITNQQISNEAVVSPQRLKLRELVDRLQAHTQKDDVKDKESKESEKSSFGRRKDFDHTLLSENTELDAVHSPQATGIDVSQIRERLIDGSIDNSTSSTEPHSYESSNSQQIDMINPSLSDDIEDRIEEIETNANTRQTLIDTDMQSDVAAEGFEERIGSLMLSPTIITKRLHQAIKAIEMCQWNHVSYLVSANPWLAEMPVSSFCQKYCSNFGLFSSQDSCILF